MTPRLDDLGFLIHDVARLMRRRFEVRAGQYGLSAAQWRLLFRVAKDEGATQARLAEHLEIEPISVSRHLDRMEEAGWVERQAGADDRRVRAVHLSAQAREAFADIKRIARQVYGEALAGLGRHEQAALIAALETMAANLAEPEASGVAAGGGREQKATHR